MGDRFNWLYAQKRVDENVPLDRRGAHLHEAFQGCLDKNKYLMLYATWAVVIPWSYMKKSIGPFTIGTIMAVGPDIFYANWRCDDVHKQFKRHCDGVKQQLLEQQQHQAQQAATRAGARGPS